MRQWLSLRIRPSATKEKKKGKEYVRRMRSNSRKNTSTDLEEVVAPIDNWELKRQLDAKMNKSQFLKTIAEHGITIGLQVIPQAFITPIIPTIGLAPGEGVSQAETTKTQLPPTSQTKEVEVQPPPASSPQQATPIAVVAKKRKIEKKSRNT